MRKYVAGSAVALLLLTAAPAQGQVAWDGPLMVSPSTPAGWGLYLVDPAPGDGIGVMTTWRRGGSYGFRLGLAEDGLDDMAVYGGVDVTRNVIRASEDFPLDMNWVLGVGMSTGDAVLLSFPAAISVGRSFDAEGVWFNPYVAPRVVLDAWLGRDVPGDDVTLDLSFDLGVDIAFDPGWAIRFAASAGDRSALAIGFSFRIR
jgi:hypothetical protein